MTDNSRWIAATVTGAVMGGVTGYLLFTERGRTLRRQIEPAIDDMARELGSFRRTIEKTAGMASEGWRWLSDAVEAGASESRRYPRQMSPY